MSMFQKIFKPLTTVVLFWFESPPTSHPHGFFFFFFFLRSPGPPLSAFRVTLRSGGYRFFLEPYNNLFIIIGGREIFQKSIIILTTSNNQRLGNAFDDLDPTLSLLYQVGDDVIYPRKIYGDARYTYQNPLVDRSTVPYISTPIYFRSVFFLCRMQ